jgi:hypothetical protein
VSWEDSTRVETPRHVPALRKITYQMKESSKWYSGMMTRLKTPHVGSLRAARTYPILTNYGRLIRSPPCTPHLPPSASSRPISVSSSAFNGYDNCQPLFFGDAHSPYSLRALSPQQHREQSWVGLMQYKYLTQLRPVKFMAHILISTSSSVPRTHPWAPVGGHVSTMIPRLWPQSLLQHSRRATTHLARAAVAFYLATLTLHPTESPVLHYAAFNAAMYRSDAFVLSDSAGVDTLTWHIFAVKKSNHRGCYLCNALHTQQSQTQCYRTHPDKTKSAVKRGRHTTRRVTPPRSFPARPLSGMLQ